MYEKTDSPVEERTGALKAYEITSTFFVTEISLQGPLFARSKGMERGGYLLHMMMKLVSWSSDSPMLKPYVNCVIHGPHTARD